MSQTMIFNQWLKQRRKALGLTQKDLAQQVGCAEVTLRKIEAGDFHPSATLAASLAKAVGAADADLPAIVGVAVGTGDVHAAAVRWKMPSRPHNLPLQLTPLLGRDHDIAALRKRLAAGERLITLLGPPGVGKTRLAQAVAEEVLEQFEDGAFFVRLAPISDPELVAATIAQTLGLQMSGSNPPALQLRAYLEEKHLLLVLDNFEQIIEAAPLVDDLLRRCAWLHVLVTSRQPLRVRGERQAPVRPLALPADIPGASQLTAADVLRYSAVALFAERAEMVQPDFAVTDGNAADIAELCCRLDGLPLAIELVAARVRLLSPAELLARLRGPWLLSMDGLRDVSPRQKTLRSAIGWSYSLLTPTEQTLFTRLAVFVGGCTLEAAEMLCGADAALTPSLPFSLSPPQVLDGIASLLDKSLLHRQAGLYGEPRYVMLETVREYGLERLSRQGEEPELRKHHANCILWLVEKAEKPNPDTRNVQRRRLIDEEIFNARAAFAWAKVNNVQAALLVAAPLLHWYGQRGPYAEGRHLMEEVLALPGASVRTIPRVKVLLEAGILMHYLHEDGMAQSYEEEAIAISDDIKYELGMAEGLLLLGRVAAVGWSDQESAYRYLKQSNAIYRTLHDPDGISYTLLMLSLVDMYKTDYQQARAHVKDSLAVAQRAGIRSAYPLGVLGTIAYAEGDLSLARSLHEQRLTIERQRGEVLYDTLTELAKVLTRQGDLAKAHSLLEEASLIVTGTKNDKDVVACECYMIFGNLAKAEGDPARAVQLYRKCLPGLQFFKAVWGECLLYLAGLADAMGEYELVARLLGTIETVEKTLQPLHPIEGCDRDRLAEAAGTQLGAGCFNIALAQGHEQEFARAAEEAVSIIEEVVRMQEQAAREARHA